MLRIFAVLRNEKGATAIEYDLIAGLIAVVIIGALSLLGDNLTGCFQQHRQLARGRVSGYG